jgi:hypothetical protein
MGKASIDVRLSTTGIGSCISIIILLNNNQTFVYHMDPLKFDLEINDDNVQTEIQKFIKTAISKFNKCGNSDLSFEKIYLIGGLDNELYEKLNTELDRMKENYSTVSSIIGLNVDDLRNFLKAIEYSNLLVNIDGLDFDEACGSTFISDLNIVLDRTTIPPIFFIAQYYGIENELCGSIRNIKPQLMPRSTITDSVYDRIHTIYAPYTTVFLRITCDSITIVYVRDRIRRSYTERLHS